jgi:predicted nuclease of predicted toxin-antitoxin system
MRLKLDENLGFRWRDRLREVGHDVDTVIDEKLSGASDVSVLEAAVAAFQALVTLDVDFANPLRFPPHRTPGIAVLRVHDRPGRQEIDLAFTTLIDGLRRLDLSGRLWIIEPNRIRQYRPGPADQD